MKQGMKEETFKKRMNELINTKWRKFDNAVIELVNEYLEDKPEDQSRFDGLDANGQFSSMLDNLALRRGWIEDRLNGRSWEGRRATKKIRKALGYTIP